ncbi:MAG: type II secretion system F family protein [Potamolinea sp.]
MTRSTPLAILEKARFFHEFATLLNSGISVQQSLSLVGKDFNLSFRQYLQKVSTEVASGQDLASALALESRYFDGWTISLIRLAEYSGSLPQIFTQLANDAEAQARREKLYRSLNLSAIAIIWSLLILTAVIFNRSPLGFIRPEFWLRSLAVGLLLFGISFFVSRFLRRSAQLLLKNLPLVGKILSSHSMIYLAKLQLPLSCGVPILAAVDLVRSHIPDSVMRANLASAAKKIRAGETLSNSLQGKLLPIALEMIRTGEETGNLDAAFHNLAQYYEGELERKLKVLEGRLRLLSILAIGALVATVGIRGINLLLNSLP